MKTSPFQEWLATSPLASAARVFVAIILTLAVADWVSSGSINFGAWQTWLISAIAACLPTITRWLNPADIEFGRGAFFSEPFDIFNDEDE